MPTENPTPAHQDTPSPHRRSASSPGRRSRRRRARKLTARDLLKWIRKHDRLTWTVAVILAGVLAAWMAIGLGAD